MDRAIASSRMRWVVTSVLLLIVVGWFLRGQIWNVGEETSNSAQKSSHQRMLDELRSLSEQSINDDPIFGLRKLRSAQQSLDSLGSDAPLEARINGYSAAGDLELLAGETVKAAEHLASAYEMLASVRDRLPEGVEAQALLDVAIAHLRLAEVQNCVQCNTCDSCILPIREAGIHTNKAASRKSIEYLTRLLELEPENLKARWLLNIATMTVGEYPDAIPEKHLIPPVAFEAGAKFPRFINRANDAGVDTVTLSGGVVADDFDNDGWIDIMTSDWADNGQLRLFRNATNGQFVETTESAGLQGLYGGLNLIQADYDNDGDIDVLVLRGAWRGAAGRIPNSLLQNDGRGNFVDVSFDVGIAQVNFPTQNAAWADYDNDGDLDLFVGNESYPCQLFQNDGRGHFFDVAELAGVTNESFTKGCSWGDFNSDGFPDLYVSNYGRPATPAPGRTAGLYDTGGGEPNRLYRNNRDGTFTDIAPEAGVTYPLLGFPTWFWDCNNDGNLDLFAASYAGKTSDVAAQYLGLPFNAEIDRLYLGNGHGEFRDVSEAYGIDRVSLAMGANFGDLDNDGFDDFYLATGAPEYDSLVPNIMYHNRAGQGFENVTAASGLGHLQKGHAVAFADFDNDGDQELFVVLGGAYRGDSFANALFNNPGFGNHWIKIALVGVDSNRCGIGARLKLEIEEDGKQRTIYKWVNSGGSFGANPLRKEIGLGKASKIRTLEVYWPASNQTQQFHDVQLDKCVQVKEGSNILKYQSFAKAP